MSVNEEYVDTKNDEEWQDLIDNLVSCRKASNNPFNDWEVEFIDSVSQKKIEWLSDKQKACLDKCWEKV